ncbi:MAG: ammonium transporter [Gammaproteobacteria bacterium]|nr:ammonium transporter [Gammaproteobacteria bacterium]MYF67775.1 ammonium transporter [Gammaproteobacteria bacterium]MYK37942.1 ammonium transporter [Gammaproteobacteria bacterium]
MKRAILIAVAGLLVSGVASADTLDKADTAWLLTSTALVLFMTLPGLALFYGGLVGRRNVLSVLMQCFTIAGIVTFLWVIVQYSLAFSDGGAMNQWVGGFGSAFLAGVTVDSLSGTAPETIFIAFQLTFAIITCALIVGGFAERMQFSAMVLFSILWSLLVYAPICHWVWGGGWLADMGFLDFAGGAVVHLTAGVGALVAAMVLGSRTGFPQKPMPPHSLPLTVAGAGMLWVGWFGFNGGSALAADGAAAMALLVTHIGASAGAMGWMAMEWIKFGKPSVLGVVTGMVAGLGTITPASGFVGPIGAMIIGLAAGVVCFYATRIIKRVLVIDDSLDVFPVHGVGGSLGLLLCAVFVNANLGGAGYAEGMNLGSQLGVQAIGLVATFAWTAVATWVILKVVGLITPLRVSEEDEIEGLDLTQHEERGYSR